VLHVENGRIAEAGLTAGGVAPLPWRLTRSEAALVGRAPDAQAIAAAGDMAVEHARPLAQNGFKVALLRNAVIRALQTIGG
jgi:xanthine dehydrogenase YagS FAD-binding subunit